MTNISQIFKYPCSFDIADFDWGSNSKTWIDRLNKCGLKPVQEVHAVAYAVKCQHARRMIQVHAYPGGVGGIDVLVHAVVPRRVTSVRAEETPGFVVVAQQAQWAFALPADAPVGHPYGELPAPLNLPVEAASGQRLPTQHLGKAVEPVWVVSVGLQVPGAEDFSAVFWDVQLLVGRVRIQFQLAKVCKRGITTWLSFAFVHSEVKLPYLRQRDHMLTFHKLSSALWLWRSVVHLHFFACNKATQY